MSTNVIFSPTRISNYSSKYRKNSNYLVAHGEIIRPLKSENKPIILRGKLPDKVVDHMLYAIRNNTTVMVNLQEHPLKPRKNEKYTAFQINSCIPNK